MLCVCHLSHFLRDGGEKHPVHRIVFAATLPVAVGYRARVRRGSTRARALPVSHSVFGLCSLLSCCLVSLIANVLNGARSDVL